MTNLTDLLPAGAGGKQVSFTASGAIAQGKPVILNTAGTVTQVTETSTSESKGSVATFDSNTAEAYQGFYGGYDTNVDVHFFGYRDTSDYYPKFKCLTISGSTLTVASTTTLVSNDNTGRDVIVTFHPNTNLVVALTKTGTTNYAQAITIASSGSSITQGSAVNMSLGHEGAFTNAVYDEDSGYIVASYQYNSRPYLVAYKPSGSGSSATVTVGSSSQVYTDTVQNIDLYYDKSQNKIVVGYSDNNVSDNYFLHPVSVNSSTGALTVGTRQNVTSEATQFGGMTYDENANRGIWAGYFAGSTADKITMYAIKLNDDDSFTTGTPIDEASFNDSFNSTGATSTKGGNRAYPVIYHPVLKKSIFLYRTQTNSYLGAWAVTCTDTTLTVGTKSDLATTAYGRASLGFSYDPDTNYIVIPSRRTTGGTEMLMQAYRPAYSETNLTATNFIGIADAAISDTASGNITIKGGIASNGLSSLTPGSTYYVQSDGTLSTTSSSVTAGKALSATSINLDYSS